VDQASNQSAPIPERIRLAIKADFDV
jgi:hypothetical protein